MGERTAFNVVEVDDNQYAIVNFNDSYSFKYDSFVEYHNSLDKEGLARLVDTAEGILSSEELNVAFKILSDADRETTQPTHAYVIDTETKMFFSPALLDRLANYARSRKRIDSSLEPGYYPELHLLVTDYVFGS